MSNAETTERGRGVAAPPAEGTCREALDRRWRTVLLGVFLVAVVLRLVYAAEIAGTPIPELYRGGETDMAFFVAWARVIAGGDWLTDQALHPYFSWQRGLGTLEEWHAWYGGKQFHQAPLYPYLLAVLFRLGIDGLWALYALQALGSALSAALIASIARRLIGPVAGVLAGVATAAYGPLLFYDFVALRASLTVLSAAVTIRLAIWADESGRPGRWAWVGVAVGLAYLLRPNASLMLPLIVLVCGWRMGGRWRRRALACFATVLGFAASLIPLIARNVAVGVDPLATSSVGAQTFYLSNVSGAPGTGWGMTPDYGEVLRRTAGRFWPMAREALDSHPSVGSFVGLLLTKVMATLHYFERSNNANPYYAETFSGVLRWATLRTWFILPLAAAGLVATWHDRKRVAWLYVAILAPLAVIVLVYQTGRFRLPMMVGLIPLAAVGLEAMLARRGAWAGLVLIAVAVGAMSRWPSDTDPPYVQPRDYAIASEALSDKGDQAGAVVEARKGVEAFGEMAGMHVMLIRALVEAGRLDEAEDACRRAMAEDADDPRLLSERAAIELARGRAGRARTIYHSLVRRDPRHGSAVRGLCRVLLMEGPTRDLEKAEQLARHAIRLTPNSAEGYRLLGEVLAATGREGEALEAVERGIARLPVFDEGRRELERVRDAMTS